MAIVVNNGQVRTTEAGVSQYTGEKAGGELRRWKLFGTDATEFIRGSYGVLSSRNATLYNISAIAKACIDKPILFAIGEGLVFRSLPNAKFLGMSPETAKEWGERFSQLIHFENLVTGHYDKQPIIKREADITGDSLVSLLREDGVNDVAFDTIPAPGGDIDWQKNDDDFTLGIKRDRAGRQTAFWSKTDNREYSFIGENGDTNVVKYARNIRAQQVRGYGMFYSEISRAKGFDRVWDATIERVVLEATQLGWFNASDTDVGAQAEMMAELAAAANVRTAGEEVAMSPISGRTEQFTGGMYQMKNSEGMQFTDLKAPSDNFGMFNEWTIKHFGMARLMAPEVILSEYGTSFTAHKGALNDFEKLYMFERKHYTREVENPLNLARLKHYAATGQIEVIPAFWTNRMVQQAYLQGTYLGPVPGHINPLQEVNAYIKAEEKGYQLPSTIAARYAHDFTDGLGTWAEQSQAFADAQPTQKEQAIGEELTK
jgi:hypothetical protein